MDKKDIVSRFINEVDIGSFVWRYYINTFNEGWMMPEFHHHKAIELIHVIDGHGFMKFGDDVQKLTKNNGLLIMPECEHRFYVDGDHQCTLINLHFVIEETPFDDLADLTGIKLNSHEHRKFAHSEPIGAAMQQIVSELSNKQSSYELGAALRFGQLFVELSRALEIRAPGSAQTGEQLVKKVGEYIDASLSEEISPSTIAEQLHFTSSYLMHIFKDATDMSLMEFVRIKRIEKSKELLSGTELKISAISVKVGIVNAQHFSSLFKKYTNMTPKEYRKMTLLKNNTDTNIYK
ncbi:MAG: helix-turn-helix transcriptional regulator [Clostridia bacterium]|jgi:AraC family transcriptional regulator, melibiose operon regulatory protein|nr:helix-turn-helix transcriptional regulator [Clostridia bacterium]